MRRVRLVKVIVQPVVVIDDGESLTEVDHPAIAIPAEDWHTYSSERFAAEMREWEARLNAEGDGK